MSWLQNQWRAWQQDRVLGRLLRNTSYLFSGNTISLGLSMAQSILAARLLGVEGFGVVGTITVFTSTINRLFSFRMGEFIIRYLGKELTEENRQKAGAVVKVAMLIEGITSLVAFGMLMLLAPLGAKYSTSGPKPQIVGSVLMSLLVALFALIAKLQVPRRTRAIAPVNVPAGNAAQASFVVLMPGLTTKGVVPGIDAAKAN